MIFLPKCRALYVVLEKGHDAREKGHGAREKGHGIAPCLKWLGERLAHRAQTLHGPLPEPAGSFSYLAHEVLLLTTYFTP